MLYGLSLSTIPLSVGCPDPSMLSNIFQETVPDNLIDISFSSPSQQQQQTFLTSAAVTSVLSGVSSPYSSQTTVATATAYHTVEGYSESELGTVQEISCLNLQPASGDLEIPLFTVPSLEDVRSDIQEQFFLSPFFRITICIFFSVDV
jgi:hypothetical protein